MRSPTVPTAMAWMRSCTAWGRLAPPYPSRRIRRKKERLRSVSPCGEDRESQNSKLVRHPRRPLIRLSFPCRESRLQKSSKSMHFCDMLIGYARVSTDDQDLALQRAALKAAGGRRLYEEKVSGAKRDRPELVRMLDALRDEDVVVVTRLDRLARSTKDLL